MQVAQIPAEVTQSDVTEGCTIVIRYRNYRGEEGLRRVQPTRMWFGETPWHPGAQWLLDAVDLDREVVRSFAMCDILEWHQADSLHVPQ